MKFKELIKKEIEYYINECNFTDEELEVFKRKCNGESRVEISMDLCMCVEKVTIITNNIKYKIKRATQ